MLLLALPGTVSDLFFSVAPDPLVPPGWTRDQDAITDAMGAAEEFIHVEVRSCRVFGVPLQHPRGAAPIHKFGYVPLLCARSWTMSQLSFVRVLCMVDCS